MKVLSIIVLFVGLQASDCELLQLQIIYIKLINIFTAIHLPTLKSELDQFHDVINFHRITEIIREYWENDPSIQALINYLKSDKFKSAWNTLMQSEEIDDILDWMRSHGVDFHSHVRDFGQDISRIHQSSLMLNEQQPRLFFEQFSLTSFEDEIRNEIKQKEVTELIDKLLNDGNDFAHLYLILKVSKPALENVFANDDAKEVAADLIALGVNVEYMKDVIYRTLRWDE
jgi:hypothetical protein